MSGKGILAAGAAALACTVTIVSVMAGETPLGIKPGLWEMTSVSHSSGPPPIPPDVLAGMTPEQRAKVEAAMQAHQARQGQPHMHHICITEEQLKKGFNLGKAEEEKKCTRKVLNSTAKVLDVEFRCKGGADEPNALGKVHYEAASPTAVKGNINMVLSGQDAKSPGMTMDSDMSGKWLAADCGSLKPNPESGP